MVRLGKLKTPPLLLAVWCLTMVALSVSVTRALGITAPEGSLIVPWMFPVPANCANAAGTIRQTARAESSNRHAKVCQFVCVMSYPPKFLLVCRPWATLKRSDLSQKPHQYRGGLRKLSSPFSPTRFAPENSAGRRYNAGSALGRNAVEVCPADSHRALDTVEFVAIRRSVVSGVSWRDPDQAIGKGRRNGNGPPGHRTAGVRRTSAGFHSPTAIPVSWSDHAVFVGASRRRLHACRLKSLVVGGLQLGILRRSAQQNPQVRHLVEMEGLHTPGRGDCDEVSAVHAGEIETRARIR